MSSPLVSDVGEQLFGRLEQIVKMPQFADEVVRAGFRKIEFFGAAVRVEQGDDIAAGTLVRAPFDGAIRALEPNPFPRGPRHDVLYDSAAGAFFGADMQCENSIKFGVANLVKFHQCRDLGNPAPAATMRQVLPEIRCV